VAARSGGRGSGRRRDPRDADQRRADIVEAALTLFAQRGYKQTTADDIAERAGVSRRTFFYYFASKDDVLFTIDEAEMAALSELVRQQPAGLSPVEAVLTAFAARSPASDGPLAEDPLRRRAVQLRRAASLSAVLRGKELDLHLAYVEATSRGLAARDGAAEPTVEHVTAASIAQAVMHLVVDRWVAGDETDRATLIAEHLEAAKAALVPGRPTARAQRRAPRAATG